MILEFPSLAAARAFWESEEYGAVKPIRLERSRGQIVLTEGVSA